MRTREKVRVSNFGPVTFPRPSLVPAAEQLKRKRLLLAEAGVKCEKSCSRPQSQPFHGKLSVQDVVPAF